MQFSSSQVIPYGVPNRPINLANNGRTIPNAMALGRGMPMANNQIARNFPLGANNLANAQNFANNLAYGNMANANIPNIPGAMANQVLSNERTAAALVKESLANGNFKSNLASAIQANNIVEPINSYVGTSNIANGIAYTGIPNDMNSNMVTYNFGNDAIPFTITSGSPGNLPIGIRILADNLEVNGAVSVIGKMPIYGAVSINGNVPTDGTASVNYNCGKPPAA